MINTRPNVDVNGYYNVTETARALELDRHTVHRYVKDGLLKFNMRKAGRRKVVKGSQIIKVWEGMYF